MGAFSNMFYTIKNWDDTTSLVMTKDVDQRDDLVRVVYDDRTTQLVQKKYFKTQIMTFHPSVWVSQGDKLTFGFPQ